MATPYKIEITTFKGKVSTGGVLNANHALTGKCLSQATRTTQE